MMTTSTASDIRIWAYEEDHASLAQERSRMTLWRIAGALALGALVVALFGSSKSNVGLSDTSDFMLHLEGKKSASPYKATQFISFTINTMGGIAKHDECIGRDVAADGTCYLGSFDIEDDVVHRALIVKGVLDVLKDDINKKHPDINHRDDVLKIFAMPEFYWRGPYGAYTLDQIEDVVGKVFDRMEELISDKAFSHYLFVFGTIIAVKPPDQAPTGESLDEEVNQIVYGNFCPVYKGGPTKDQRFLVTKKYISNEDFLNREKLPNPRNYNMTEYKHSDFSDKFNEVMKKKNMKIVSDNVLDVDSLNIGLEICLDHNMSALWDNLQESYHSELMDLHIVTSAGMSIQRGPNPVIPGGVTYISDGTASSAACLRSDDGKFNPETSCRAFGPKGPKHMPVGGKRYSEFFPMAS
jgi:hypothetical protein